MVRNLEKIGILGAGGQADETESYLPQHLRPVRFRAVTREYAIDNLVVIEDAPIEIIETPVVAAIGSPAVRSMMIDKWPGSYYGLVISEHAVIDASSKVGEGSVIAPGSIITTNVSIGEHSIVNVGATISHDTVLGKYVTICPGVHIGGGVKIGDGVFVGIGASIRNGIVIADGTVIGAGAAVLDDISVPNGVYVGVPARRISTNKGWLHEV